MIKTLKISALLAINVMLWWATLQLLTAERVPMFMTPQQVEDVHDWDDCSTDTECDPVAEEPARFVEASR